MTCVTLCPVMLWSKLKCLQDWEPCLPLELQNGNRDVQNLNGQP